MRLRDVGSYTSTSIKSSCKLASSRFPTVSESIPFKHWKYRTGKNCTTSMNCSRRLFLNSRIRLIWIIRILKGSLTIAICSRMRIGNCSKGRFRMSARRSWLRSFKNNHHIFSKAEYQLKITQFSVLRNKISRREKGFQDNTIKNSFLRLKEEALRKKK